MAKTFDIKLPKSFRDLRIKHMELLVNPLYGNFIHDTETRIDYIKDYTGWRRSKVRQIVPFDIEQIYVKVALVVASYKPKPVQQEIVINGKEYELIDPKKVGIGWHIDYEKSDKKDLVRIACLMYHPKGVMYGNTDENENLTHPIATRYADFEQFFPLDVFLDTSGFFLTYFERSLNTRILQAKIHLWTQRLRSTLGSGRK